MDMVCLGIVIGFFALAALLVERAPSERES